MDFGIFGFFQNFPKISKSSKKSKKSEKNEKNAFSVFSVESKTERSKKQQKMEFCIAKKHSFSAAKLVKKWVITVVPHKVHVMHTCEKQPKPNLTMSKTGQKPVIFRTQNRPKMTVFDVFSTLFDPFWDPLLDPSRTVPIPNPLCGTPLFTRPAKRGSKRGPKNGPKKVVKNSKTQAVVVQSNHFLAKKVILDSFGRL